MIMFIFLLYYYDYSYEYYILTILINNYQMIFSLFRIIKNTTLLPFFQKITILSLFQNYHSFEAIPYFGKQPKLKN
jgi:hypothetical protein